MKLKNIDRNQTLIIFNDGTEIFFSFEQAVAGYVPGLGFIRTDKQWSKTTNGHINKYLEGVQEARTVPQAQINMLKTEQSTL